ncbi:alpha/beta fold hydrolase [Yersinia massiliensis]|uniref:alpha/beta fold hydrolase n=1 Tax=Yersinia massiliensis TaxID=419257 RepID=UPI0002D471A0|nr:alpha/beta fold hydrolase [Yersinia massiliensis]
MKKHFLLVHGAWQGAWAWEPVVNILKNKGYHASVLDLPGSGNDRTPAEDVTLESYANAIISKANQIAGSQYDLVLVGHSMGGAAVTSAASLAPDLFAKIIYVCAFLPQPGESVASLGEESDKLGTVGPQAEVIPDQFVAKLYPDKIAGTFFNDCDVDKYRALLPLFRPQPIKPILAPASWSEGFSHIPKAYIRCNQDKAISPQLQALMAQRAGITSYHQLDSGHEPFVSVPAKLAALLVTLAKS